ncbi:MAG: L-seryl-tRNA(Sec) selenium transferase [Synergistaceae bacterium]|nr:L-seryl-tRNA(Sec) selenium transferase [Synergistaceae bacterium]
MRAIPGMDTLLFKDWIKDYWIKAIGREPVKEILNQELAALRHDILNNDLDLDNINIEEELKSRCIKKFERAARKNLRRVINATGVVIHTNLGRSLIAQEAIDAMAQAADSYSNLEYDIDSGTRGQRNSLIENLLCSMTGAEAALVVNNNAGAVLLCLSALAKNSDVIVSRGELVEIGGSFRVPDIMAMGGAVLKEVGTTNRTHLFDYENAINENTKIILKVHPSNFRIEGFVTMPERSELAELAHKNNLIFMEDAGSGLLVPGETLNLVGETSVKECLNQGVDLITFSGDKMLGGPQIGVIAGKKDVIAKLRKFPMLRALRVDKSTFAAFEATLRIYMRGELDKIPTLEMIRRDKNLLREQADNLAAKISERINNKARVAVVETNDAVGGGSYPERPLIGWGVAVSCDASVADVKLSAGSLLNLMRENTTPIICGAHENALIIHVRTLLDNDINVIANRLEEIFIGNE